MKTIKLLLALVVGFVFVLGETSAVFAQETSKDDEGVISSDVGAFCIPPGENWVTSGRITNYELGQLIPQLESVGTVSGIKGVITSFITMKRRVAGPLAGASFLYNSMSNVRLNTYKEAYWSGKTLYYYVKKNPSYNGYNALHLTDWYMTNSPIC